MKEKRKNKHGKNGGFIFVEHIWALLVGTFLLSSLLGVIVGFYKAEKNILQYIELMTTQCFVRQVLDFKSRFTPYKIETSELHDKVIVHENPKWTIEVKNKQFYKVLSDGQYHAYTESFGLYNKENYYVNDAKLIVGSYGMFCASWEGRISKKLFKYNVQVGTYPYRLYYGVVKNDF